MYIVKTTLTRDEKTLFHAFSNKPQIKKFLINNRGNVKNVKVYKVDIVREEDLKEIYGCREMFVYRSWLKCKNSIQYEALMFS